jgi:glycosyltransferase involved in cell wall biosynthesis
MSPQVSVIIPAYNGDRFIGQAVESVLQQPYPNCELIVVNDGSSDATAEVLQAYGERIRYVEQPNQGVAAARNRGLALAQGEWIAFLDQDDYCSPDKLTHQIACLEKATPQVGMIHSGWQRVDAQGQALSQVEPWYQAPQLDLAGWIWWKPVLLSAMLFRRSGLEQVGGFDSSFQQTCDLDLVLRLTLKGWETLWLKEITVHYREHDRNESRNALLQAQENQRVMDRIFALPDLPASIRQTEAACRYHTLVWSAWRLYQTDRLTEMAEYLERSLAYRPFLPTEALLDWITHFSTYSAERHLPFDVVALTQSSQWNQLMMRMIGV